MSKIKKIFNALNNMLMGGIAVLFIAFNAMFYSIYDKEAKISIYSILIISFIFYLIILIIYAVMKNENKEKDSKDFKIIDIFKNDNGIHLILKENSSLTVNIVCSIYYLEKSGYENFCGLGYVYNIAKDNKIDIKMIDVFNENFIEDSSKNKKRVIIKTELNYENIQSIWR